MSKQIIDRRELENVRRESSSHQRKILFNWKLLKENLTHKEVLDLLISRELVKADLWDYIKNESQRVQMDSILTNAVKHVQSSNDYNKFEAIVTGHKIRLQTPKDNLIVPVNRGEEDRLQANREIITRELYPKDHIDDFLEWFILSIEDHEVLRNNENVRQHMAHSFLEKIMNPTAVEKGSMTHLIKCFKEDQNCILMYLSTLLCSGVPNGNPHFIADKNLQSLLEKRDCCRNTLISKWTYLTENFYPYSILIDELHNGGLVDEDRGAIINEKPRREQVNLILRNIIRRIDRPEMFSNLISILKKENNFIAEKLQDKVYGMKENVFRQLSDLEVKVAQDTLQFYDVDIVKEFYSTDVDIFLECLVFDVDDHEIICETGKDEHKKAWCFYKKITDQTYIEKGSFECLLTCLKKNENLKKSRQKLAECLMSCHIPKQVKNRTTTTVIVTGCVLYQGKTSKFTEGKLKLTVDDAESKTKLENKIFEVAQSAEYKGKEIDGLKLKVKDTERSSVVVHLKSDTGNVLLVVKKGIVNGDLTSFIKNLLNDETIKMHMSPGRKYNLSVTLHSKKDRTKLYSAPLRFKIDKGNPKLRIIKENRELLEEEYDPLPLLKAVFEKNVGKYKSVKNLSPEYVSDFKEQFREINKLPERRKRVKQFLDIAEDTVEADTLWELIADTANAFSVKKMRDDFYEMNSEKEDFSVVSSEEDLVFEGKYEVWITEEDVKSPLQSMILEEEKKKEEEQRRKEEESRRTWKEEEQRRKEETRGRKRKREEGLNEDVIFWKQIRNETLPMLDDFIKELKEANEKIKAARSWRKVAVYGTVVGSLLFTFLTGGMSTAGGFAAVFSSGVVTLTLVIENYVEKNVLQRTQCGINRDKKATIHLIAQVKTYGKKDRIPFADNLRRTPLEGIGFLSRDPIEKFLETHVDIKDVSLLKAIEKLSEFRELLERELLEVERIQGQHFFR